MKNGLHILAVAYRALQLYAHMAHNQTRGSTFFSDHQFLGELYSTYESAYDDIIERMIGIGEKPDIQEITKMACDAFCKRDPSGANDMYFKTILHTEHEILELIDHCTKDASQGTANLLQNFADDSEKRCYKIIQRIENNQTQD